MDNTHIWEIDMTQLGSDAGIQLEIFSGRDKYTKAGLFSGPLRRQEIDPHSEDAAIRFLFSMTGATQTGKNTFRLSDTAASRLLQYFEQRQMSGVYCRLQDKKRHRVKTFIGSTTTQKGLTSLIYDSKSGALVYPLPESAVPSAPRALERPCSTIKPVPHLYLNMEENQIRGFLTFTYDGTEIQANSKLEEINLSSVSFYAIFVMNGRFSNRYTRLEGILALRMRSHFTKKFFSLRRFLCS